MKKLYLIGGTMGVGKTTTCQILKKELDNCVYLDGDWCWDMDPFQVNNETKSMVLDNISHLLSNFIHCDAYENIVFSWVMHEQEIIDKIVHSLDLSNCSYHAISLVCDTQILEKRLEKDIVAGIREQDIIEKSVVRIPLYSKLDTLKIDTSHLNPSQTAHKIINLIL